MPVANSPGGEDMSKCIFCLSTTNLFSKEEHIVPESLGGVTIMPPGYVCDCCNGYFGTQVEQKVLEEHFGLMRALLSLPNKRGKPARIEGKGYAIKTLSPKVAERRIGIYTDGATVNKNLWVVQKPNNRFAVSRRISSYNASVTSAFLSKIFVETASHELHYGRWSQNDMEGWMTEEHRLNARFRRPEKFLPYVLVPVQSLRLWSGLTKNVVGTDAPMFAMQLLHHLFLIPLTERGMLFLLSDPVQPPFTVFRP